MPTRSPPLVAAVAWGISAYLVHAAGNAAGLYTRYVWFQALTHVWSASALALAIATVGLRIGYAGAVLASIVVAGTFAGAVLWEAVEYFDVFAHLHYFGPADTALDVAADAVGTAAALATVRRLSGTTRAKSG